MIRSPLKYLIVVAGLTVTVAVMAPFQAVINSTTVALVLLLVVLVVATGLGTRPGYFASALAVIAFNLFFLPPLYAFTIADPQNWIALAAFLVTAVIAGQLSAYARHRTEESETRRMKIEQLYDELKDAFEKASHAEALRQSEQLKSALLDAVTHDLRTPLTSIKASATILKQALSSSEQSDMVPLAPEEKLGLVDLINEETDRLNEFIGGIVDLARLEAGKTQTRKAWNELGGIIDAVTERARVRLNDHELSIDLENELPAVRVDAEAIGEVIYLFLDNAAKYSAAGSEIKISGMRSAGETVEVWVEDQGSGVVPELRERVFEKFYRPASEDVHSTGSGLGVGLAIVRGIAESQDGRVWIEDGSEGFRTKFIFRFPVGDDENEADDGFARGE